MKIAATFLLSFLASGAMAAEIAGKDVPQNPFLANSPWPMSARNPYNQGSSPLAGPSRKDQIVEQLLNVPRASITLAVSNVGEKGALTIWGATPGYHKSSGPRVYTMQGQPEGEFQKGATLKRRRTIDISSAISGVYVVADNLGNFIVPEGDGISVYRLNGEAIEAAETAEIPKTELKKQEIVVGINMTYDGYVVFATNHALVGVIKRDDLVAGKNSWVFKRLVNKEGKPLEVSNSLAVDEKGGIFVVTSETMTKLHWDGKQLKDVWSHAYPTKGKQGTLGKGSGTTPVLLGSGTEDRLVAIGDGSELMHAVLYWRDEIPKDWKVGEPENERRVAASTAIRFGDPKATRSFTDQHFVAWGHEFIAVSNTYGSIEKFLDAGDYRKDFHRGLKEIFNEDLDKWTIVYSNRHGVAPYGMEKFRWNPTSRTLESVWANTEVSCPNSIPTMSAKSGLAYCIGQSNQTWSLEALDWNSGKKAFSFLLTDELRYNSFYATTQICADETICSGLYGGAIFLRTDKTQ